MSLRRLSPNQPAAFAFSPANDAWANKVVARYPQGRRQSAVIPLLWKGQEQEGWVTKPMIEAIAERLGMAPIRVLEVATFYTMFHLAPVGRVHVQVCGTTPCMLRGAGDLVETCKRRIGERAKEVSADGQFSWEEVECLGACVNAPMIQIGKDYYEDLDAEKLEALLDAMGRGETPAPGPQNGRFASEPEDGAKTLDAFVGGVDADAAENGTTALWRAERDGAPARPPLEPAPQARRETPPDASPELSDELRNNEPRNNEPQSEEPRSEPSSGPSNEPSAKESSAPSAPPESSGVKPETLTAARGGAADDLKRIRGVGPKLEALLHSLGYFHFDQIAAWTDENIAWVDVNLEGFKGRVTRDDWVGQAKVLAGGGETEFSKRVDAGDVPSSNDDSAGGH